MTIREDARRAARSTWVFAQAFAPLLIVLGGGLLLRVYLMASYRPASGGFRDSIDYLTSSKDHLFGDPFRPAGYPLFLRTIRLVVPELSAVIAVQHLLGLATGALLYLVVRRLTGRRWLPALPAGMVVLSGDQLLLEHAIMTESLYTFLATAGLCGLAYAATTAKAATVVLALSGIALGAATTVRSVAIPLIGLAAVWLFFALDGPWRHRVAETAYAAVPALAVLLSYLVFQGALTGTWGVSPSSNWALYARMAPIADCEEFEPPRGTAALCESTPSFAPGGQGRPGPGYYQFVAGPAITQFGNPFETQLRGSEAVGRFARAALLHQPLDYGREVGRDMLRYIEPTTGYDRPYGGAGEDELDITRRAKPMEERTIQAADAAGFDAHPIEVSSGTHALQDLQRWLRVQRLSVIALLSLAIFAILFGRGAIRSVSVLMAGAALLQALVPVATISWAFRYGLPPLGQLAAAATLGIQVLVQVVARRTDRGLKADSA